ncbi:monovalent cation/H+ antiporter subunit D [Thiobaca trueperi]|uniref:Multisubunit potassium/proton antiporter PhaD subunit n=1 Tax=Thiobaca trueperi TaxID=127458 RepID=A0A4R3MZM3_9GAMM|nr:monovalent cation/H+ antiporter subunit D [Thiobaca trueperi]TCT21915.1 multisubunit potassium/proton antiporter PhaD subunit [Thiobaca trueperi]
MNHLVIAPLLLPLLTGTLLLLLRRVLPLNVRRWLSLAAVTAQVVLAALLLLAVSNGDILVYALGNWPAPYGIVLVADRLSAWMLLITALLAWFALLHAIWGTDPGNRHFHPLFQLQLFGLSGAFLTGDLFNLFVFFEILLLASYGLLLHGGGAVRTRAGLHFVALNLAGSTLFLFAAGTFYGTLGTLNMADLAVRIAATPPDNLSLVRAAGLLLFGVFALKAALVPLHLWLPAAYSATSAPVAALFAIMTKVGVYALLRVGTLIFGGEAGPVAHLYAPWLLPLALATLMLGVLGALSVTDLRRQIAYLVVVSVGLLLTAFSLGTQAGIAAGLYYLAHTTFAAAAFFLLADSIARGRGERLDRLHPGPPLAQAGLVGGLFFITAVLIAGLPPLSGFLGKFLVLRAALAEPVWPWVMGLVLTSSLLVVVALARSGSLLFFRAQGVAAAPPVTAGALLPVAGLLALCLALTLQAGPLVRFTQATADQLLHPQGYIQAVLQPIADRETQHQ